MANSIDLVTKFLAILREVYKLESKTSMLDALTRDVNFAAANVVEVMKMTTVGLGTYSRTGGYPDGDITAEWVAMTLAAERGRAFTLDRMDNEESLGLVLGNLIRTWMREHVAPEMDAYRFAKYATGAGLEVAAGATLAAGTVLDAIDEAKLEMDEAEVPEEGRKLYVSSAVSSYIEAAVTRMLGNENRVNRKVKNLDDMEVIKVPQTRFYTAITLDAGATGSAGGYAAAGGAKEINFLMMHPSAVTQPVKLNQVKYFSPDVNQQSDGHLWQYRLYHDAFVVDNHEDGIYLHKKAQGINMLLEKDGIQYETDSYLDIERLKAAGYKKVKPGKPVAEVEVGPTQTKAGYPNAKVTSVELDPEEDPETDPEEVSEPEKKDDDKASEEKPKRKKKSKIIGGE